MIDRERRDVLKTTGLAVGGSLFATGVGTAARGDGHADDESSIGGDADWTSLGGNPGNNPVAPAAEPKPPVTVAWEYDHGGPVAVVDGAVFLTGDGAVHALHAGDGSVAWTSPDVGADGSPAVGDGAVYVGGDGLTALDIEDGQPCCRPAIGDGGTVPSPTVVDDLVLVVADGVCYALEAGTEAVRWTFEPDGDELFDQPVAVGDGAVFATSETKLYALELADGTVRWTEDDPAGDDEHARFTPPNDRQVSYPVASDGVVAVGSVDSEADAMWPQGHVTCYDAATGERLTTAERGSTTPGPIANGQFFARDSHEVGGHDRGDGDREWNPEVRTSRTATAAVGEETVYVGLEIDGEAYPPNERPTPDVGIYAFNEDGTVTWAIGTDEVPHVALADGTLYAGGDRLLAIRSNVDDRAETIGSTSETGGDGIDESATDTNESNESRTTETSDEPRYQVTDSDEADAVPGFGAGVGVAGGAVALEWLRRRAGENGG